MKKTYINPEMDIIKIQTQQIIAVSGVGIGKGSKDPTGADARGFDFDDEE